MSVSSREQEKVEKNDSAERERKDKNIRAGEVLQIVLQRSGSGESGDTSFIKLIDSLSEFLLVCVFRQS